MIFNKSFLRLSFFIILLLFSNLILVNSANVKVNIVENSTVVKLLTGQYSLVAEGTLEIVNPSNFSRVYEFNIPLSLDALVGINQINLDSTSSKFNFKYDKIKGYFIEPNSSIRTKYKIFGLLNYDISNVTSSSNISVFEYYTKPFEMYSNVNLFLQKPQREGFEFYLNGTPKSSTNVTNTRLVSAGINNPTDFSFFAKELKLYRTTVSDPYFRNGELLRTITNFSINPLSFEELNLFDHNSSTSSVYWMSSNFLMNYDLTSINSLINEIEQRPETSSSSGGSGGSSHFIMQNNTKQFQDSVLLKKSVDKTMIGLGAEVKVSLRVVNINNFKLYNLSIVDIIPKGYEIKDVSSSVKISGGKLSFNIAEVDNYETFLITYILKNKNSVNGITYLKPAVLISNNVSIFSDGVLLINDLLSKKKVFVQKEITYINDKYAKVSIKVKNLGSSLVEDILVVDNIDKNAILKEISKLFFERGSWRIKSLSPGSEWEVTYLVNRDVKLNALPNIYGVDKTKVYGTLVSSEEIVTVFKEPPKTIEKVGMVFAVGLLVFYLLF